MLFVIQDRFLNDILRKMLLKDIFKRDTADKGVKRQIFKRHTADKGVSKLIFQIPSNIYIQRAWVFTYSLCMPIPYRTNSAWAFMLSHVQTGAYTI